MKISFLLSLITMLLIKPCISHVNLTKENTTLKLGDSETFKYCNIDHPGSAGINVHWDFTKMDVSSITYSQTILDPLSLQQLNNVPSNANKAIRFNRGGYHTYEFYEQNDNALRFLKYTDGIESILFTNPLTYFLYPLSFKSSFTDFFSMTSNLENQNVQIDGKVEVSYDAFGKLTLPWATIDGVVRVKRKINYTYNIQGEPPESFEDVIYAWYKPGISFPVFEFWDKSSCAFMEASSTNLNMSTNPQISGIKVYPNPASTYAEVGFSLTEKQEVKLSLIDLTGKEISRLTSGSLEAGTHKLEIDLSAISNGIYLVRFKDNKHITDEFLIIDR